MYLNYYGLKEKPFTLSPNPRYLYYSESHKEAYSNFIYAITQQSGYMVLTGEVGTGKTTIVNAIVKNLGKDYQLGKIYHTSLSPKGLIQNICKEFNIHFQHETMDELLFMLHEHLKLGYRTGHKAILIIDEAQNLSSEILEEIRLLSNFEAMDEKFLQILLVGQPELDTKLRDRSLRQLRERIGLSYQLRKLNRPEAANYINHRLSVAGWQQGRDLFTEEAVNKIHALSSGIPRRINILCDSALLMGYAQNLSSIGAPIIEKVGAQYIASRPDEAYSNNEEFPRDKNSVKQLENLEKNGELNYVYLEKIMDRIYELYPDLEKILTDKNGVKKPAVLEKKDELDYEYFQRVLSYISELYPNWKKVLQAKNREKGSKSPGKNEN